VQDTKVTPNPEGSSGQGSPRTSHSYGCDGDPPKKTITAELCTSFLKDSLHIKEEKQVKCSPTFASKLLPFFPPLDSRNTVLLLEGLTEDGEKGRR